MKVPIHVKLWLVLKLDEKLTKGEHIRKYLSRAYHTLSTHSSQAHVPCVWGKGYCVDCATCVTCWLARSTLTAWVQSLKRAIFLRFSLRWHMTHVGSGRQMQARFTDQVSGSSLRCRWCHKALHVSLISTCPRRHVGSNLCVSLEFLISYSKFEPT